MIGQGTFIRGNVRGEGDLTVAGRIEGGVEVDGELLFEETATMKGDVTGRRIVVRCALLGNLHASESIALESGARVVGDLIAPHIGIEDGALVRGRVETGGREAPARTPSATARAAAPVAAPATASAATRTPRATAPARPVPPRTAARRAPAPAIVLPASLRGAKAAKAANSTADHGPPAPVVPALKKKATGTLKKGGAYR